MHFHVESTTSTKKGGSKFNSKEAEYIADWISKNIEKIKYAYRDIDKPYLGEYIKDTIGIITPFKAQVKEIKDKISDKFSKDISEKITVGTVHTFQGAECNIIILSTVYGSSEGCFFIDNDKSLLNVAVSRSKDHFFVVGDINCLQKEREKPSGLLRYYCTHE
jgi:superfamily I DNA and/or RNA helicase